MESLIKGSFAKVQEGDHHKDSAAPELDVLGHADHPDLYEGQQGTVLNPEGCGHGLAGAETIR